MPSWALVLEAALAIAAYIVIHNWDELRRSVVIFYDFEKSEQARYADFLGSFEQLLASERVWNVQDSTAVDSYKYNSGASSSITRKLISRNKEPPKLLKTNIDIALLDAGNQLLAFFPDRLLVFDEGNAGAVSYADLKFTVSQSRFIESDTLPDDAEVIGSTWRYINKSGGPDRRFSDNPQYPIALYERVHLTSSSGLNEMFQISHLGASAAFAKHLKAMASVQKKQKGSKKS